MDLQKPPLEICPMDLGDIEGVAEIERLCFPTPWTKEALQGEIGKGGVCFLVARMGEAVTGHIGMWLVGSEAHITTFAVHPNYRNQGIGQRLLHAAITQALARNAIRMTLEVRASSVAAQRLYRKFGFVPIAIRKKYYAKEGEDAIVMWIDEMQTGAFRERLLRLQPADTG